MEFGFSEEQEAIRDTARRFAADKLAPSYRAREESGVIDRALVREMGALGLIAADLPEELGGLGLDSVSIGVIIEEIAYADLNVAYIQLLSSLIGQIVGPNHRIGR